MIWEVFTVIDKNIEDTEKVEKALKELERNTNEIARSVPRKKHLADAQSPNAHSELFEKVNLEGKDFQGAFLAALDQKRNRRFSLDQTNRSDNGTLLPSPIIALSKFAAGKLSSREESQISFLKPFLGQPASELASPHQIRIDHETNASFDVPLEALNSNSQFEKGNQIAIFNIAQTLQ